LFFWASPGERIIQRYQEWEKPDKVVERRDRIHSDKTRKAGAVRWQAPGVLGGPWNFDLIVEGTTVTGTVGPQDIYDGNVEGSGISFKVTTPDGNRTVAFSGKMDGSEISFTRNIQFRNGTGGALGRPGVFGMAGEMQFVAKRVE
jgi:hypothetical protein